MHTVAWRLTCFLIEFVIQIIPQKSGAAHRLCPLQWHKVQWHSGWKGKITVYECPDSYRPGVTAFLNTLLSVLPKQMNNNLYSQRETHTKEKTPDDLILYLRLHILLTILLISPTKSLLFIGESRNPQRRPPSVSYPECHLQTAWVAASCQAAEWMEGKERERTGENRGRVRVFHAVPDPMQDL